jgi:hypothetical protein
VPKHVEVKPEDLHISAATVDAHADTVRGGGDARRSGFQFIRAGSGVEDGPG